MRKYRLKDFIEYANDMDDIHKNIETIIQTRNV